MVHSENWPAAYCFTGCLSTCDSIHLSQPLAAGFVASSQLSLELAAIGFDSSIGFVRTCLDTASLPAAVAEYLERGFYWGSSVLRFQFVGKVEGLMLLGRPIWLEGVCG